MGAHGPTQPVGYVAGEGGGGDFVLDVEHHGLDLEIEENTFLLRIFLIIDTFF